MKMNDLISVIVPIFNRADSLVSSVASVQEQTYSNLQIILVDDGSTDGSAALCDKLATDDTRIIALHQPNGGVSSARNLGVVHSQGEYILFLDADDFLHHRAVELMHQAISESDCSIAVSEFLKVESTTVADLDRPSKTVIQYLPATDFLKKALYAANIGSSCGKLYKKSVIEHIPFKVFSHIEDYVFVTEVLLDYSKHSKKLAYITGTPLYYYVQRPGSVTHALSTTHLKDTLSAAQYMMEISSSEQKDIRKAVQCYSLNAVFFTLLHADTTCEGHEEIIVQSKGLILEYRSAVLRDSNAPLRVKGACILSVFSIPLLKTLYFLIKRLFAK